MTPSHTLIHTHTHTQTYTHTGLKWQAWMALKGMPIEMAKRRFITYLAEINPELIDVMPDEKPPSGFLHDTDG